MAYTYEVPNMSDGMDSLLVGVQAQVPVFVPLILLLIWFLIFLSGTGVQKRRSGFTDIPVWATFSSMGVLMVSLAMTLIEGLMNGLILGVVIAITILSFIWLALGQSNREV